MKKLLVSLLLILSIKADLPVKCPKKLIQPGQQWTFHVSKDEEKLQLYQQEQVCGHLLPNHVQIIDESHQFQFQSEEKITIKIISDSMVEATDSNGGSKHTGTWAVLYDQALMVSLDNGIRYVANFRHNIINKSKAMYVQSSHYYDSKNKFNLKCDQTMVGFVQRINGGGTGKNTSVQCFYAVKNQGQSLPAIDSKAGDNQIHPTLMQQNESSTNITNNSLKKVPQFEKLSNQTFYQQIQKSWSYPFTPTSENDEYILWVNQNHNLLGWKASLCKLTASNPHYNPSLCNQTTQTLNQQDPSFQGKEQHHQYSQQQLDTSLQFLNRFQNLSSVSQIADSDIPESFDLRNVSGVNYAGKVRNQEACGSCYSHAFIAVVEARLRMKYGVEAVPDLSVQQFVSCNYMTEGCNGGWGIFNGFLAENVGIIKEECAPYTGVYNTGCLKAWGHCQEVARVSKSYFVEKSEKGIQKEILKNGMVDISMAFPLNAANYESGIMGNNQVSVKQALVSVNDTSEAIDDLRHASVIVGWGVENDVKYWIVRNSYGDKFGEKGDFKIIRGYDWFHTESFAVAFEVELLSSNQQSQSHSPTEKTALDNFI